MSEKKKILLIDGNNMFFRAYCASPALNINGDHVGAITGFMYSLQKCIKNIRPHKIFVVWDGQGGSRKRQDIRTDYKEGRKAPRPIRLNRALDIPSSEEEETNSRLYQMSVIIQLLNELPIVQLCEKGVEADDFISYLNAMYSCDAHLKVIVSNDKDFMQLLNNCTILFRPITEEYVTFKSVVGEFCVHPQNMALARAIVGDTSDNLSGVSGVGFKKLTKLIPEFADASKTLSIDDVQKLCEERKDSKASKAILDCIDVVKQNYSIMQLYMPMIPFESKNKVDEQISSFKYNLNMDNFTSLLKKEGIFGSSLTELLKHCESIANKAKME